MLFRSVEEIAKRIAPVDDAVLFAGAAHPIGPEFDMTMTAENAAKTAKLLGAQRVYILTLIPGAT